MVLWGRALCVCVCMHVCFRSAITSRSPQLDYRLLHVGRLAGRWSLCLLRSQNYNVHWSAAPCMYPVVVFSKFFPSQALSTTRALFALFNPLVQARKVKVRFVFTTAAQSRHAWIGWIKAFHANDTLVIVCRRLDARRHGRGHLFLQQRAWQDDFTSQNGGNLSTRVKRRCCFEGASRNSHVGGDASSEQAAVETGVFRVIIVVVVVVVVVGGCYTLQTIVSMPPALESSKKVLNTGSVRIGFELFGRVAAVVGQFSLCFVVVPCKSSTSSSSSTTLRVVVLLVVLSILTY